MVALAFGLAGCTSAPEAKDGTDLDACRDGDCEVAVSKPTDIPLDDGLGVTLVSITEIDTGEVTVSCGSGDLSGNEGSGGAKISILEAAGPALPCGRLELRIGAIGDGTAVVVLDPS